MEETDMETGRRRVKQTKTHVTVPFRFETVALMGHTATVRRIKADKWFSRVLRVTTTPCELREQSGLLVC